MTNPLYESAQAHCLLGVDDLTKAVAHIEWLMRLHPDLINNEMEQLKDASRLLTGLIVHHLKKHGNL